MSNWLLVRRHQEIITGAFDSQSLGIGGAHVIALRQPALFEPAAPMESEEKIPQMKFQATILDGEPQKLGVRFDERLPLRSIRKKYGDRRAQTELEVKPPPISFRSEEQYREDRHTALGSTSTRRSFDAKKTYGATGTPENPRGFLGYLQDKGTYESISDFMNGVRRPLKTRGGSDWNHSQHLNSMQNKTNCFKKLAVTDKHKFERLTSYQAPPSSARSWKEPAVWAVSGHESHALGQDETGFLEAFLRDDPLGANVCQMSADPVLNAIVLGGTTIHNSMSFLTDVAQLGVRGAIE
eukprot:s77_g16.t1